MNLLYRILFIKYTSNGNKSHLDASQVCSKVHM